MKHILFISTHNFATNPRLVKEIKLALEAGYAVSVLCCEYSNWSKANNETIKKELLPHISYYPVSGDRRPFTPWLLSSVYFKAAGALLNVFKNNIRLLSVGSNKRSWLLLDALKHIRGRIDLVLAHNPGSFYPAALFATSNNIPFGIDLEDYHPGETSDARDAARMKLLNKQMLPKADYVSAASPLIAAYSKADIGAPLKRELLLLNYFEASEFRAPVAQDAAAPLSLVWFSQNISHGRGLEELVAALQVCADVVLHLYGNMDAVFYETVLKGVTNIVVHAALPQGELHAALHQYDLGLALEKPASNLNRDLCITNKILAYYQAGLFIIATSTSAQEAFIQEHGDAGEITGLDKTSLSATLQKMVLQKGAIRSGASARFLNAREQNWEKASRSLLNTWNQVLS